MCAWNWAEGMVQHCSAIDLKLDGWVQSRRKTNVHLRQTTPLTTGHLFMAMPIQVHAAGLPVDGSFERRSGAGEIMSFSACSRGGRLHGDRTRWRPETVPLRNSIFINVPDMQAVPSRLTIRPRSRSYRTFDLAIPADKRLVHGVDIVALRSRRGQAGSNPPQASPEPPQS